MAVTAATDMVTLVPRRYAEACRSSAQYQDLSTFLRITRRDDGTLVLWHSRVHDDPVHCG